jgi:hypothetical protein
MKISQKFIKKTIITLGMITLFSVMYLTLNNNPEPANAACGVATSSCLACHEELGKNPVNTNGDWHVQHQIGDFCQACHQGNPNEDDSTKAHEGVIQNPLTSPEENCQACHSSDFAAKAAQYGSSGTQTALPGNASKAANDSPQTKSKLVTWILIVFNLVALVVFIILFQRWRKLRK